VRIVVVVLLLLASIAHAETRRLTLDDAKRLEAQLEFEPALAIVDMLIETGGNSPERLVELHLFAGKLAAGLDRGDIAQSHFGRVLSLAPSTKLPEGISPKILLPFDAARAKSGPLVISDGGQVVSDPMNLVSRIHRVGDDLVAVDVYDNRLWSKRIAYDPIIVEPVQRPVYKRPVVWGSIAVTSLAVAGLGAWRFSSAQNEWNERKAAGMTDFTELQSIEDRGRRWGLVANVGAAAAVLSTVLTVSFAW
jgi:hypothetical protein